MAGAPTCDVCDISFARNAIAFSFCIIHSQNQSLLFIDPATCPVSFSGTALTPISISMQHVQQVASCVQQSAVFWGVRGDRGGERKQLGRQKQPGGKKNEKKKKEI
eukprot:scaffold322812_cov32-Tisochrysis_lutea.AAC.1